MKKFNFMGIMLAIIILGCSTDHSLEKENSTFKNLIAGGISCEEGTIHNDFLGFVNDEFIVDPNIGTKNEAFSSLESFVHQKADNYFTDTTKRDDFKNGVSDNLAFFEPEYTLSVINNTEIIENHVRGVNTTLDVLILDLKNNSAISNEEYDNLMTLNTAVRQVMNHEVISDEFYAVLDVLNNTENLQEQHILKNALCIGNASKEWWNTNTPGIYLPSTGETLNPGGNGYVTMAIPVAVGTDIAGAVGGAAAAAGMQYVFNNGEINWQIVAGSALVTAVTASTGVFGRIGNWLSNL